MLLTLHPLVPCKPPSKQATLCTAGNLLVPCKQAMYLKASCLQANTCAQAPTFLATCTSMRVQCWCTTTKWSATPQCSTKHRTTNTCKVQALTCQLHHHQHPCRGLLQTIPSEIDSRGKLAACSFVVQFLLAANGNTTTPSIGTSSIGIMQQGKSRCGGTAHNPACFDVLCVLEYVLEHSCFSLFLAWPYAGL